MSCRVPTNSSSAIPTQARHVLRPSWASRPAFMETAQVPLPDRVFPAPGFRGRGGRAAHTHQLLGCADQLSWFAVKRPDAQHDHRFEELGPGKRCRSHERAESRAVEALQSRGGDAFYALQRALDHLQATLGQLVRLIRRVSVHESFVGTHYRFCIKRDKPRPLFTQSKIRRLDGRLAVQCETRSRHCRRRHTALRTVWLSSNTTLYWHTR